MRSSSAESLIIFIVICTFLIALLISFITFIVYRYQQKQNAYYKDIESLKALHANELLRSQLEIQEQTFENISREIHDNIGQKLTLAKLHLNTLDVSNDEAASSQLDNAVSMIGEAINDLSDISRSMSSEIILHNGLIRALEFEVSQLNKSKQYRILFSVQGDPVFFDANKELVIFRIIQEALSNIIKHAFAKKIEITAAYHEHLLLIAVCDDGHGFMEEINEIRGTGIANMHKRAGMLNGRLMINSEITKGTCIRIEIPIYESERKKIQSTAG